MLTSGNEAILAFASIDCLHTVVYVNVCILVYHGATARLESESEPETNELFVMHIRRLPSPSLALLAFLRAAIAVLPRIVVEIVGVHCGCIENHRLHTLVGKTDYAL